MKCNSCKISGELSELKQLIIRLAEMFRWFDHGESGSYMFTHMDITRDISKIKFPWEGERKPKSNKEIQRSARKDRAR